MIVNEKLTKARKILENKPISLNLFFVTREVKDGISKSAKVVDKYCFKAWSVDASPDLDEFFLKNLSKQLDRVVESEGYELEPYEVISDDVPNKLYSYALNNALSFSEVVTDQIIPGSSRSITSLASVKKNLWAYSLKITSPRGCFLMFRKLSKGKVVTDQDQTMKEKISSYFDSSTAELKASLQESITFDDKLDCIFIDNEFFVFRKSGFENIVGLEEDFNEAANDVIDIVEATDLIDGVEHIKASLKESRSLLKTLSNIAKKGHHHNLNHEEIKKMKEVLHRFEGKELKSTREGRLLLEDKNDVGYFIKLLNDYYKQGLVSGDVYGTHGGRLLPSGE